MSFGIVLLMPYVAIYTKFSKMDILGPWSMAIEIFDVIFNSTDRSALTELLIIDKDLLLTII